MKKAFAIPFHSLLFSLAFGIMATSCNNESSTTEESKEKDAVASEVKMAQADVTGTKADTSVNGTVKFNQDGDGKVKMDLEVLIPKMANHSVAVHIHEHGDCGDAGKNTHGHWNPTNKQHGKWGTGEYHSGDIGNIQLDSAGKGTLTMETDIWSIGGDVQKDILGKAIIVHSGVDDYTSQPSGNAGSRIGCGLIQKK